MFSAEVNDLSISLWVNPTERNTELKSLVVLISKTDSALEDKINGKSNFLCNEITSLI